MADEENPFLKKKKKPVQQQKVAVAAPVQEVAQPAAVRRDAEESLYEEPSDPNENPFAKRKQKKKQERGGSRNNNRGARADDVAIEVEYVSGKSEGNSGRGGAALASSELEKEENPFSRSTAVSKHATVDSSSSSSSSSSVSASAFAGNGKDRRGGKCSCWECWGFRGAFDSKVPPRGYKSRCAPVKNPPAELRAWLAEERRRAVNIVLFVAIPQMFCWILLIYMLASGDDFLYNASLIIPRNSSASAYNILLNSYITNPDRWWNQVVDTVGFVAIGWMLMMSIGPHRGQLAIVIYVILVPLTSLLALGIELDVQAPVYGNQSILFGFLGVIFAYVIVVPQNRCKHLTIALVMTGVYVGIYIGVRFAVGEEGDPVQWLTPAVTLAVVMAVMIGCLCVNEKRILRQPASQRKSRATSVKGLEMNENPFQKDSVKRETAPVQTNTPKYMRNPFNK